MDKQEVYRMIKEQVKIVDYAPRMGFTVIRKGRYFSLKEHDSVIIDPEKIVFGEIPSWEPDGALEREVPSLILF